MILQLAAIIVGTVLAALGLFALVKLRQAPVPRHVLPLWWRRPVAGPGLVSAMPCADCPGHVGRHNSWCKAVGGPGLPLPAERDVRQVRGPRAARRLRAVAAAQGFPPLAARRRRAA